MDLCEVYMRALSTVDVTAERLVLLMALHWVSDEVVEKVLPMVDLTELLDWRLVLSLVQSVEKSALQWA